MRRMRDDVLACRLTGDELAGWFVKEVSVEEGQLALLLLDGRLDRVLGPGVHNVGSFWSAALGRGPRQEVVLVRSGEMVLPFHLSNLLTRDPLLLELDCTPALQYERGSEGEFLANLMGQKDQLVLADLRSVLFEPLRAAAACWFRTRTIEDVVASPSLTELRLAMEEAARLALSGKGVEVVGVSVGRPTCAAWDEKTRRLASSVDEAMKLETEVERRRKLSALKGQLEIEEVKEETEHLARLEQRAEAWRRAAAAMAEAEMDQLRTAQGLQDFRRAVDRDQALKDDDFRRLMAALEASRDDEERARAHAVRMAELEAEYEYRQMELRKRTDLTRSQVELETGLQRLELMGRQNLERMELDLELERSQKLSDHERALRAAEAAQARAEELVQKKHQLEMQGLEREARRLDKELDQALEEKRRAQERLDVAERNRLELEKQAEQVELEIKNRREALELRLKELRSIHEWEMQRLTALKDLPIHVLIATGDPAKVPILGELAALEMKRGMSVEQILALAVEKAPELRAYLDSLLSKPVSDEERRVHQRLVDELKQFQGKQQVFYEENMARYERISSKAMESLVEMAKALAPDRAGMAAQTVNLTPSPKLCPKCSQAVAAEATTCHNCEGRLTRP